MEQFKDVDWLEVLDRLTLESLRMFNANRFVSGERVLASYGDGFEDLAQRAILDLLDEDNPKLTWSAVKGPATTRGVVALLSTALRHDYLDMVRAKRLKGQIPVVASTDDDDEVTHIRELTAPGAAADERLLKREETRIRHEDIAQRRKRLDDDFKARPDEDLQLYLMHVLDGGDYTHHTPRDVAKELGVDVKQIYLLKEKLERRINRLFKEELAAAPAGEQERPHEPEAR